MTFLLVGIVAVVVALTTSLVLSWWDSRNDPPVITDREIIREARAGNTGRAIRWYRTLHGGGIKEAKRVIDHMRKDVPRA